MDCRGIAYRKGNHSCIVPMKMTTLRRMPVVNLIVSSRISRSRACSRGSSRVVSTRPRYS
ncbi:MAG: hypothetical protein A4E67_01397 [Syntrophaceae bacterium PtaB.Bin038]|nr:MAG: hypothetical protein A4E67_01397 [Syntrophaceae bacterium PtaB.Bin038]